MMPQDGIMMGRLKGISLKPPNCATAQFQMRRVHAQEWRK